MNYQLQDYRRRVLGCFLGKNAGGTLGMRDEWHRRINHVDGYVHEITGEPLPNDDMDLQLVWLVALEEQGVSVDAGILGDYWMYYITPHYFLQVYPLSIFRTSLTDIAFVRNSISTYALIPIPHITARYTNPSPNIAEI